jgi:cell division protein FtsB
MPSWDRPRGGSDSGGDKPPAPKEPPYVPYPPVNPAREQAEGTSQNSDSLRAKDKPPEERGARGSDHSRRPGDTSREANSGMDKNPGALKQYQTLFERQGELIDTQKQRIDTLKTDVDKLEKRNDKLEARNDRLEARLEQRDQTIDRQAKEIDRLKVELAKRTDKPGEGESAVRRSPLNIDERDGPARERNPDTPWYKKFPSEKLVGIGTTLAGLGQAIASYSGHMSSAESGLITAGFGVGVSILGYAREKYTERKARNADRPEN